MDDDGDFRALADGYWTGCSKETPKHSTSCVGALRSLRETGAIPWKSQDGGG
jgi:hypothetical protein